MKHPFIILVTCIWLSTQVPVAIAQQAQLVEAAFSPSLLPDKQSDSLPLLGITGRVRITDNDRFLSEVLDLAEQARGLGDRSESGVLLLDFETDSLIAEMKELDGQFATGELISRYYLMRHCYQKVGTCVLVAKGDSPAPLSTTPRTNSDCNWQR